MLGSSLMYHICTTVVLNVALLTILHSTQQYRSVVVLFLFVEAVCSALRHCYHCMFKSTHTNLVFLRC
jgi:hypothetical protein